MKATTTTLPQPQQDFLVKQRSTLLRMAGGLHYRYINCSLGTQHTVEDIVQEGLLAMFTAGVFPPMDEEQLLAWAYTTMKRRCLDRQDNLFRQQAAAQGFFEQRTWDVPEDESLAGERVAALLRTGQQVLSHKRQQVVLGYALGRTGKQIARDLQMPQSSVRHQFFMAKKTLLQTRHNWAV